MNHSMPQNPLTRVWAGAQVGYYLALAGTLLVGFIWWTTP